MSDISPSQLRVSKDRQMLTVTFNDGNAYDLPAEMLRVMSPSAEVQGHSPEQRKVVGGKKQVQIMQIKPVGNYAVRIVFDDMHDTGIFSWAYLSELGRQKDQRWAQYLDELAARGLTR